MRFQDLRIGVRVSAGYAILLLLMLGMILVAVSRIAAIRAESARILEHDWLAVAAIDGIDAESREAATRIVTLIIQPRKADRVGSYAHIDALKASIDARLAALERLDDSPAARRLVAALKDARARYYDSFIAVADQVEGGEQEGARQTMNTMAMPALDTLLARIKELDALQTRQVRANAERAAADINDALMLMMGMGVVALLVGVGFAVSARSITRPLARAVAIATRVAQGDLSSVIEVTSKDETGELLQALTHMTASLAKEQALRRAVEVAEDATKMKSDFLANMSHEIRTPMNGIIGMTHLALQTELTARQRNYLEKVESAAKNLLGIINDILDFSKIEAGKLAFEQVPFYLEDVLQQVADLAAMRAQDKGLELLFDIDPAVPMGLTGDPLRLGQVLVNLASNAIKFTERGEVVVSVRVLGHDDDGGGGSSGGGSSDGRGTGAGGAGAGGSGDGSRSDDGDGDGRSDGADAGVRLRFAVRDTGVGLSTAQLGKLFSAFSQADTSTTRHYGGTGLGLTISKRLVEMMDGSIGVDSTPGAGSTFYFTARFGVAADAMPRPGAGELSGLRVLVVDDNASARTIFCAMLATLGFEAEAVDSGARAIDTARAAATAGRAFDLVLMDWQMPGLSGVAAIEGINGALAQAGLAPPACIVVTAYARDVLADASRHLQLGGVLSKPVSASTLLDTIAAVFGKELVTCRNTRRQADYREAAAAVRGASLLLVDDNEVNQEVAQELLHGAGIHVDVASNGAMALAKLAVTDYDGVLMDCQMPVMDGYEATRRLRANPRYAALPVIAMTANAMVGDKDRCLAAGMNDFIAKPIDVGQLFTTLARWVRPSNPDAPPAMSGATDGFAAGLVDEPANALSAGLTTGLPAQRVAAGSARSGDGPPPPIAGLKMEAALARVGGNGALMRKLLARFAETQHDALVRIVDAIDANDVGAATRAAHTLKGLAGNIGAGAVADVAGALEQRLARGELDDLDAQLAELGMELGQLVPRIVLALNGSGAARAGIGIGVGIGVGPGAVGAGGVNGNGLAAGAGADGNAGPGTPGAADASATARAAPPDTTALAAAMQPLALLLAQDDAEAAKLIDQLCPLLTAAGQGEHARQLRRLAGQYAFEEALVQLQEAAAALQIPLETKEAS